MSHIGQSNDPPIKGVTDPPIRGPNYMANHTHMDQKIHPYHIYVVVLHREITPLLICIDFFFDQNELAKPESEISEEGIKPAFYLQVPAKSGNDWLISQTRK